MSPWRWRLNIGLNNASYMSCLESKHLPKPCQLKISTNLIKFIFRICFVIGKIPITSLHNHSHVPRGICWIGSLNLVIYGARWNYFFKIWIILRSIYLGRWTLIRHETWYFIDYCFTYFNYFYFTPTMFKGIFNLGVHRLSYQSIIALHGYIVVSI